MERLFILHQQCIEVFFYSFLEHSEFMFKMIEMHPILNYSDVIAINDLKTIFSKVDYLFKIHQFVEVLKYVSICNMLQKFKHEIIIFIII